MCWFSSHTYSPPTNGSQHNQPNTHLALQSKMSIDIQLLQTNPKVLINPQRNLLIKGIGDFLLKDPLLLVWKIKYCDLIIERIYNPVLRDTGLSIDLVFLISILA